MRITPDEIEMLVPDDWHCHLRQEKLLRLVVSLLAEFGWSGRVVVMPNTKPPILTGQEAQCYRQKIIEVEPMHEGSPFELVMSIQITEDTTPAIIRGARECGVRLGKFYPKNMTTHSENGIENYEKIYFVLQTMQEVGMIASFHGESPRPRVEGLDKEQVFLDQVLKPIREKFPGLRIVLEHITTESAVEFVLTHSNIGATITPHHLFLTLDDVIGYSKASGFLMRPHHFCKPVAKFGYDREALCNAAMSGNPRFFYGSDAAPHLKKAGKHCEGICAGIFNIPVALSMLIDLFGSRRKLEMLEPFLSFFGADFYGLPRNQGTITLKRKDWKVPLEYEVSGTADTVVPWLAGETMHWKLQS